MICLHPIAIRSKSGPSAGAYMEISCGQCRACLVNRRERWVCRLLLEHAVASSASFINLTYSDTHLPEGGILAKRDIQLFLKRLRKRSGLKIRYFICGEYGLKNSRPHYHGVLFGLSEAGAERLVHETWKNGFVVVGDVTLSSIRYVCKYMFKGQGNPDQWALMSTDPGLGYPGLTKVAKALMASGIDVIPTHLRISGRRFPLDRWARSNLSELTGVPLDVYSPGRNLRDHCVVLSKHVLGDPLAEARHQSYVRTKLIRSKGKME